MLELAVGPFAVSVINEPSGGPLSRSYESAWDLGCDYHAARHGVVCIGPDGRETSRVLRACALGSVHGRSAVAAIDTLFVAVGAHVVALRLPDLTIVWTSRVDPATCFGVHYSPFARLPGVAR